MQTTNISTRRLALIAVLVLGSSAWLGAQNNNPNYIGVLGSRPDPPQQSTNADLSTNIQSSQLLPINKGSSLIGATIRNLQGEELGKVRDLVIDFNSGRVDYLVLNSATGWLGPQKLHAVPLRAFQLDAAGTSLILNADKSKFERAEGFAKDNWPSASTAVWGAEPFWKETDKTSGSPEKQVGDQQDKESKEPMIEPKKTEPDPQPQK